MTSQSWKNRFDKEDLMRIGAIAALAIFALGLLYSGYRWYRARVEAGAQKLFSQSIDEYQRLQYSNGSAVAWQEIEQVLKNGYDKNSSSAVAPFFLAYQADILLKENKFSEALELINKSIKKLPHDTPFYFLMSTKAALIKLDSTDENIKQEGMSELERLAQEESNNPFYDMALYYIGYQAWASGNRESAHATWSKLQKMSSKSYWAELSRQKEQFLS